MTMPKIKRESITKGCNMPEIADLMHDPALRAVAATLVASVTSDLGDTKCWHAGDFHVVLQDGQPTGEAWVEMNCSNCVGKAALTYNVETDMAKVSLPDNCPLKDGTVPVITFLHGEDSPN